MKINRFLSISLLCFCAFYIFPQTVKADKAKDCLDKTSAALGKAGSLAAHFTMQVKDTSNKISESFEGDIEWKGEKFHLDTPDMEIWFDGKTQWVLQKEWDEVNVSELSPQEAQALNPVTLLLAYKQSAKCKYLKTLKDAKGREVHEIEMTSTAKNNDITKITVQINADYFPIKIHLIYKNKIENMIHIKTYTKNANLPDSKFVFDAKKYPEVEIIDLR